MKRLHALCQDVEGSAKGYKAFNWCFFSDCCIVFLCVYFVVLGGLFGCLCMYMFVCGWVCVCVCVCGCKCMHLRAHFMDITNYRQFSHDIKHHVS